MPLILRRDGPPIPMTAELLTTPLHDWHAAHGGRIVEFGGWSMPVQYTSIAEEHNATRNAVGVFDISHMGRLQFFGTAVAEFLDTIVTRRVVDMKRHQVRYALICNEAGGILDDVLVYAGVTSEPGSFWMVVNASNREKIFAWLKSHESAWLDRFDEKRQLSFGDSTLHSAMIAVQGPKALGLLQPFFKADGTWPGLDLANMKYYHVAGGFFGDHGVAVSRTGYTGEDGFEIVCEYDFAAEVWGRIISAAEKVGGRACGLGARDTLRLEAAMPLYGHELSESINPFQAGLGFAVNLDGREFIGCEALKNFAADKSQPVRVGLQLDGKRVPREGYSVLQDEERVGEVTSGTFSPTFERPIAMAYVRSTASAVGTRLAVDIRGTQHAAVVVPLPFYERGKN